MARKLPSPGQALLITLSGAALALVGCLGTIAGLNMGTGEANALGCLGAVVFLVGLAGIVTGAAIWVWPVLERWVQPSPRHNGNEPPTGA
jgi:hypothetical protein